MALKKFILILDRSDLTFNILREKRRLLNKKSNFVEEDCVRDVRATDVIKYHFMYQHQIDWLTC